MANEIRPTFQIYYENGSLKRTYQPNLPGWPQATKGVNDQTITASSTYANVSIANLTLPGVCIIHNLESTTTGRGWIWALATSTGGMPTQYFKLPATEMHIVRAGGQTIRGKCDGAGPLQIGITTFES